MRRNDVGVHSDISLISHYRWMRKVFSDLKFFLFVLSLAWFCSRMTHTNSNKMKHEWRPNTQTKHLLSWESWRKKPIIYIINQYPTIIGENRCCQFEFGEKNPTSITFLLSRSSVPEKNKSENSQLPGKGAHEKLFIIQLSSLTISLKVLFSSVHFWSQFAVFVALLIHVHSIVYSVFVLFSTSLVQGMSFNLLVHQFSSTNRIQ